MKLYVMLNVLEAATLPFRQGRGGNRCAGRGSTGNSVMSLYIAIHLKTVYN